MLTTVCWFTIICTRKGIGEANSGTADPFALELDCIYQISIYAHLTKNRYNPIPSMELSHLAGYALLLAGIFLSLLPFVTGPSTLGGCVIQSTVYETIGIDPTGYRLLEINWRHLQLLWYDGCNSRRSSFIPLFFGIGSLMAGYIVVTGKSSLLVTGHTR